MWQLGPVLISSHSKLHNFSAWFQPERLSSQKLNFTKPAWAAVQFSEARETQLHVYMNLELDLFTTIMPPLKKTVRSLSSSSLVQLPHAPAPPRSPQNGLLSAGPRWQQTGQQSPSWAARSKWRWEKLRGSRTLSSRHLKREVMREAGSKEFWRSWAVSEQALRNKR